VSGLTGGAKPDRQETGVVVSSVGFSESNPSRPSRMIVDFEMI
jgi:hypothetical protein